MAFVIDLINKKFGRLTVLKRHDKKGNRRQVKWECKCDCGKNHIVTGESLRSGKSRSCGCLLREARHVKNKNNDRKKAMLLLLYSSLKKRHRMKFNNENYISFEIFSELSIKKCFYCGVEPLSFQPDIRYENRKGKREKLVITDYILNHNGIDRKNSLEGYTEENVVTCCKHCNTAKNSLSVNEFKNLILKIHENWASKMF